ncbi:hypothetical protein YPPY56_3285 [Yersinia pestis PY-56]|nr:hypothetical protein YPPY56_3285 [Yersinia pestis PY-56]
MYLRRLYDLPVLSVAGHFVNNLSPSSEGLFFLFHSILLN